MINGVEVGGGSIRIHEKALQLECLELLGFSKEEAQEQFGFLMDAFQYGAPPHGGLAFGLDRLCQILGNTHLCAVNVTQKCFIDVPFFLKTKFVLIPGSGAFFKTVKVFIVNLISTQGHRHSQEMFEGNVRPYHGGYMDVF